jgi:hypothetical protein
MTSFTVTIEQNAEFKRLFETSVLLWFGETCGGRFAILPIIRDLRAPCLRT